MAAKRTLKIDFELNDGNTKSVSLLDPKNNLTLAEVTTFANLAIQKSWLMKNNSAIANLEDAYIQVTERVELS